MLYSPHRPINKCLFMEHAPNVNMLNILKINLKKISKIK